VFLDDFLKQNGYHDVGDAVTDAVAVATVPAVHASVAEAPQLPVTHEKRSERENLSSGTSNPR
jgi:hypothetical protein